MGVEDGVFEMEKNELANMMDYVWPHIHDTYICSTYIHVVCVRTQGTRINYLYTVNMPECHVTVTVTAVDVRC